MKLALGTVQFGIKYGINNTSGVPENSEIVKIVNLAEKAGIKVIDTALSYGDAEEKISTFIKDSFQVVTKFSNPTDKNNLISQFKKSKLNLRTEKLYGYLAHNADNLIQNPYLWETLLQFKEQGEVEKIGYSLYTPDQLEKLLQLNLIPNLVQIPYSLLDRKFEPYLVQLKNLDIEIHVRSVFLQGLYFMDTLKLPKKLLPLKSALHQLQVICNKKNISIGSLALNFIIENSLVDCVVIGVEKAVQLEQNIKKIAEWNCDPDIFSEVKALKLTHKELLNPSNW